ncbi:MAG: Crp/Fnr family transcriptional regulator [Paracoccus sp. (in: a-proteobacteria)]
MAADLARLMAGQPAALLGGIDAESLSQFLARCSIQTFHTGRQIIQQGAALDQAWLVLRGAVEVSIMDLEGNCILAHLAQTGEVVGEVELLSGGLCIASCLARPGTTVAGFDLALLRHFVPHEHLLRNLACLFHERLSRDNRYHLVAMFYCSEDRIRSHLLSLTMPDQPEATISQADLAAFSGCSRQTVNRTLAQLRSDGIVDVTRGRITVLDRDRLQQLGMGSKPRR